MGTDHDDQHDAESHVLPHRWPRRLYSVGTEPDARFTLANERTFLAWIRTALALMAGGVGVEALNVTLSTRNPLQTALAVLLLAAGVLCSVNAVHRWIATELALRKRSPLPAPRLAPLLAYGLGLVGVVACVLIFLLGA